MQRYPWSRFPWLGRKTIGRPVIPVRDRPRPSVGRPTWRGPPSAAETGDPMASVQRGIDAREMELIDAYIEHLRRAQRSEQTMADRRAILTRLSRDLPYGIGQV